MRRIAWSLAVAVAGAALAVLAPATPAYAEEVYPRSSDGVFRIDGHGWGHGRGLNQWGAQGAATTGVAYRTILAKYYPGTAVLVGGDVPMRVLLQEDDGVDLRVKWATNLAVRDKASGARHVLPSGYPDWRITIDSAAEHVQYYSGGWKTWSVSGRSAWTGPLQFEGVPTVRLFLPDGTMRDYRGVLRAVRSGGGMATVNELWMEHYLYGVVPRESPASFHAEALKAQAVAARSYSRYKRDHAPATAQWDICSTIQCQVYGGVRLTTPSGTAVALEHPATNDAVNATRGEVRAYGGSAIFAEFSSSNGGWSTASTTFSYLAAAADPWDEIVSPHHSWTAEVTAAQIERRYPSVGRLTRLRVTARDGNGEWGGRVKAVILEGVDAAGNPTSVQASGAGIYNANPWPASSNGLRGSWWKIRATVGTADFSGTLVGLSGSVVVRPAYAAPAYFDVRNTGNLDWPVQGSVRSALRQATESYDAATWITPSRPGPLTANLTTPGAMMVKPGEVARFRFTIAGNGRAEGSYTETFSVVWETRYWMEIAVPLTYTVKLLFAGALVATADPVVVPGHGTEPAWFDVTNTGDMAWPLASPIHSLTFGASPSVHASWVAPSRPGRLGANVTRPEATSVEPGEVARFPFLLAGNGRVPSWAAERFGIVWEGRSTAAVRVPLDYAIQNVFTGTVVTRPSSVAVPRTGLALVSVDVRNTGNLTWPVRGAVRVSAPSTSPSRSSRWIAPTRPGAIVANVTTPGAGSVGPGEVARLSFWLAGNGRAAGTRATETFGFVFETVATMPTTVSIGYEVRESLAAGVVGVTPALKLPRSGAFPAYVDVRNDGALAWPVGGAVRLTMAATSPSRTAGWLAPSRPAAVTLNRSRPGATSGAPGATARFLVPLSGNGRAAGISATEYLGLVWEGVYTFPVRIPLSYTVADVFTGRVTAVASGVSVPSGGTAKVWFEIVNTGNLTWPVSGGVRSAATSAASRAPTWLSASRPSALASNATVPGATGVAPGQVARFEFDLAGNGRAAGSYSEVFKVVWEARAWLDAQVTVRFTIA